MIFTCRENKHVEHIQNIKKKELNYILRLILNFTNVYLTLLKFIKLY